MLNLRMSFIMCVKHVLSPSLRVQGVFFELIAVTSTAAALVSSGLNCDASQYVFYVGENISLSKVYFTDPLLG